MILFKQLQERGKTVSRSRRNAFLIVSAIVLIVGLLSLYLWYQPVMQASVTKIKVYKIQFFEPTKYSLQYDGIPAEKAEHILSHPEKYRYVSYEFTVKNNSLFFQLVFDEIHPSFSEHMKEKVLSQDPIVFDAVYPPSNSTDRVHLLTLVELDDNESEEQLVNLAKKDRFQIYFRQLRPFSRTVSTTAQFQGN